MVIRVEEPATCEYIISIHSKNLCTHPAFKVEEKVKKVSLVCAPILSAKAYNRFQEKQKFIEEEKERQKKEEEEKMKSKEGIKMKSQELFETLINR